MVIRPLLCIVVVFALLWTDMDYASAARYCPSTDTLKVFDIEYKEVLEGSYDDIKLFAVINWTFKGENNSGDGFIVRLQKAKTTSTVISIPPHEDCQASGSHLWVRTSNDSLCAYGNDTKTNCNSASIAGLDVSCPVDKNSEVALDGMACKGSTFMMSTIHDRVGKYYSIPNNRRSIKYQIEFNQNYLFYLNPYDRQIKGKNSLPNTIKDNWYCAETVAKTFNISVLDANEKCCKSNISSLAPMDFRMGEFILDRTSQTLNVTVSWIPPAPIASLQDVFRHVRFHQRYIQNYMPQMTEYVTEGNIINGTGACPSRDNRRQISTLYNLLPNTKYFVMAAAFYNGENGRRCGRGACSASKYFSTDFNPCDEKWTLCDADSKCMSMENVDEIVVPETICIPKDSFDYATSSQETKRKTTNAPTTETKSIVRQGMTRTQDGNASVDLAGTGSEKRIQERDQECKPNPLYCDERAVCSIADDSRAMMCSCWQGLVGDGISKSYNGSGCSGCHFINDCHIMASCAPLEKQSAGFKCQCDEHYFGDGLIVNYVVLIFQIYQKTIISLHSARHESGINRVLEYDTKIMIFTQTLLSDGRAISFGVITWCMQK